MSTWRDIWRYGVIANRFYAEDEKKGETAFNKLMEVYDKPLKNEKDGMIRYIMAESYELNYFKNGNAEFKNKAIQYFNEAQKLFPVQHWKAVAKDSSERLNNNQSLESFYKLEHERVTIHLKDSYKKFLIFATDFEKFLWYGFQKVYEYVHLNDFARYVCLSALSRGSSEWPLSLVDFRTVLELEIKQCFPQIIEEFNFNEDRYSLAKTIKKLKEKNLIDTIAYDAFNNIRISGNIAAHNLYADENFKKLNVSNFIRVLQYFDEYRATHEINYSEKIEYPLCQLSIEAFIEQLEKEKKKLIKNNYYS